MGIGTVIKKRQAGAPARKAKREELKALELKARQAEEERIEKVEEKKAKKEAILRGQKKARGVDFKKIGKAVGRGVTRVAKTTLVKEKPKRRRVKTAPKTVPRTRKFSGKVFTLAAQNLTKPQATKKASSLKKSGKLARIVKIGAKYAVYIG